MWLPAKVFQVLQIFPVLLFLHTHPYLSHHWDYKDQSDRENHHSEQGYCVRKELAEKVNKREYIEGQVFSKET